MNKRFGSSIHQRARLLSGALVLIAFVAAASPAAAQENQEHPDTATVRDTVPAPIVLTPIAVTATRTPKDVFETAAPVSVIDTTVIREKSPNSAADLLRALPGLDVNGIGANQTRPTIRGQRGQRILLLEDGLRLNNARRQQDFGEIPAIVDIRDVRRVEVVRGPSSVLYGTDAIGGVINLITDEPPALDSGDGLGGRLTYEFRDEGTQHRPSGTVWGRSGRFAFHLSGSYRDTDPYEAPAGSFGDITLDRDVRVQDTGVRDQNYAARLDYDLSASQKLFAKAEVYQADDAGFGFVKNEDLGQPDAPFIQILYPDQSVQKYTLGYRGKGLDAPVADRFDFTGYYLNNERNFDLNIFVPFGPPGAGVDVQSQNFTDLETFGFRAEAAKLVADRALVTYGVDFFRDDSNNTDRSVTTIIGFGPPSPDVSTVPRVPNAVYQSTGVFAQGDLALHDRVSVIVGARYQDVRAETRSTPGITDPIVKNTDQTLVGAANLLVEITPALNFVGAVGRGFRAPNLVELFFNGPTPEGSGFQARNPDLKAETSVNVDLGLKFRHGRVSLEGYAFRNTLHDGIRIAPTGGMQGPFPVFQNVNVDRLRFQGVELLGAVEPVDGLSLSANYSRLDSKDVLNPNNPIGDSFSEKVSGELGYRDPGGRFWATYGIRHNSERRDIQLVNSPIGKTLPAFTVHDVRGGVRLFTRGRVTSSLAISVENLTNELYAEFSNASFFRPEPKRTLLVSWISSF
ncbi:MAG: TonB-dependent receptor plug domain-containing protein [Gemmatimonadota bacterium]